MERRALPGSYTESAEGSTRNTVITTPGDSLSLLLRQLISIPEKQAKHIAVWKTLLNTGFGVFFTFSQTEHVTGSFILFAHWPHPQEQEFYGTGEYTIFKSSPALSPLQTSLLAELGSCLR